MNPVSDPESPNYDPDNDPELLDMMDRLVKHGSVASNPGRISVQWPVFLRCYPATTLVFIVLIAVSGAAGGKAHWGWWILSAVLTLMLGRLALNAKLIMEFGCACPAVVVSHNPDLIAVCANLSNSGDPDYWALKILSHPLTRMAGGRPAIGARLATVSGFGPGEEDGHWKDFMPVAAACATSDRTAIERVLTSFEDDDWALLETGLRQVPQRTPGLYPFKP